MSRENAESTVNFCVHVFILCRNVRVPVVVLHFCQPNARKSHLPVLLAIDSEIRLKNGGMMGMMALS